MKRSLHTPEKVDVSQFKKFKRLTLVEEIKSILQKYPDDGQIFKEIIQNADDAGAKELVFIYDENDYQKKSGHYSNPALQALQGPALYAYNDARFTQADWDGIRSLGLSNKIKDPLKVGRFGLGFKSVFHLTDLPTIASGTVLAYLDPIAKTFSDELEFLDFSAAREKRKFKNCSDFDQLKNLPGGYALDSNGNCSGTLFRFPLRQERSNISSVCYGSQKFMNLINTFINDGYMNLLFLKKVQSIKFYRIPSGGTNMMQLYSLKVSANCVQQYGKHRKRFMEQLTNRVQQGNYNILTLNHKVDIEEESKGKQKTCSFMLSEYFGHTKRDEFYDMITDTELSYIPLVAVGMPLDKTDGGHVFCGLPLPLREKCMTGLPVHVNGFFALGPDRKDLKWKSLSSTESNDKSVNWNLHLINKLLPVAYLNLIKHLIASNVPYNTVYKSWPDQTLVNYKWASFLKTLYESLNYVRWVYICVKNIWVDIPEAFFIHENLFKSKLIFSAVSKLLRSANQNIALVPKHITESIQSSFAVKMVTKETVIGILKSNFNVFHQLNMTEQCSVLSYCIQSENDLIQVVGLPILRKSDGQYDKLCYNGNYCNLYIPTKDHPKEVLPTQKNVLDTSFFNSDVEFLRKFKSIVSTGRFNLILLNDVKTTLLAVKDNMPQEWSTDNTKVLWRNQASYPTKDWLSRFWQYQRRENISLESLKGIPIIPTCQSTQMYLCKLSNTPLVMSNTCALRNGINIAVEPSMNIFLKNCGILFVNENYIDVNAIRELCSAEKILRPDSNGVINAISNLRDLGCAMSIMRAVQLSTVEQKMKLEHAIGAFVGNLPDIIKELKIFKTHLNSNYSSLNQCILVDQNCVPGVWNAQFGNLLTQQSISVTLYDKLQGFMTVWTFEDVINCILKNINSLSVEQKDTLFNFCIQYIATHEVSSHFLLNLKSHLHVKSDRARLKPSALFAKSEEFQSLFYKETNKFPAAAYNVTVLKKLGLKSKLSEVAMEDVATSVCSIQNMHHGDEAFVVRKVNMILKVSNQNQFGLSLYNNIPWIPIQKERPESYPSTLKWLGADKESGWIQPPSRIVKQDCAHLIGSELYVAHRSVSGHLDIKISPEIEAVVNHLKSVADSYNDNEKGSYKFITYHIYEYLAGCNDNEVIKKVSNSKMKIWQGKRFVDCEDVLLTQIKENVSPYYYQLPNDFPKSFKSIIAALGKGEKDEYSIYIEVLRKIKVKHEATTEYILKDADLAEKLTRILANNFHTLSEEQKQLMCVPVDCKYLKLCAVKDCFYHDFDGATSFGSMRTYNILHRRFEEEVAEKLGIPNLTSKVLSGEENSMFESWGQHESLTLRLRTLLKDYEDGMAIPKELIQNADDAGASEVFFLYDRRENDNLKFTLFDKNMKNWQGPALWAYNNAVFTELDFKNITKLNAGTKELDRIKIGRFGLGFNAVYHLTDVPSILSGNSMVVFDPHTKYLGKALRNSSTPGLRIRMHSSKKDLANFNDQFKVFHGVFGVHSDFTNKDVSSFNGTLFRLPLRKLREAQNSEISKMEYSRKEMEMLLEKFEGYLNHLLLFTENVKTIKVYELSSRANSPSEMKLLFKVERKDESSKFDSVMKVSNSVLNQLSSQPLYTIPSFEQLKKIDIETSDRRGKMETHWLTSSCIGSKTSFTYANAHKGYNPCGGVALEYIVKSNGEVNIIANTNERFVYCFLPLPQKCGLPVHVNGAFEVSKDRKQLAESSIDRKRSVIDADWNDMLGSDIGSAYFKLLQQVKCFCPGITMKEWIKIFPLALSGYKSPIINVIKSLLLYLVTTDEALFPLVNGWTKWKDIRLLSSKFDNTLSTHAISYLNWRCRMTGDKNTIFADLPSKFVSLLNQFELKKSVADHTVSLDAFVEMFFELFENVNLDERIRNKILHCLLDRKRDNGKLRDLLFATPCIPTKPNGKLNRPSELIRNKSKAAALFDVNDEVFPIDEFSRHSEYLQKLGMESNYLSWENILNRAQTIKSVAIEKNTGIATKRSRKLISFIVDELDRAAPSTGNLKRLVSTPFIPLNQKPKNSLLRNWKNENCAFGAPSQLYMSQYINLACYSALICSQEYDSLLTSLQCKNKPPFETVKEQIIQLIALYEEDNCKGIDIGRLLDEIYQYLQNLQAIPYDELRSLKLVYTNSGKLVYPKQTYFHISHEIMNHMYKLPTNLCNQFSELMRTLGVREKCTVSEYIKLLSDLKHTYQDESIPEALLKDILHEVIPFLCEGEIDERNIFLPDKVGVLRSTLDMCFKEVHWLPYESNVHYCHDSIPIVSCMKLSIKPSRSDYFQRKSIGIAFGQHEHLTTRIKNLLGGYSDTEDVLKEILQNADDAGATEVHLMLDMRKHGTERIFSDRWEEMQGPALLVANNGSFTEQDLAAIKALGEGSKAREPLKTGKYGVGFNAVYAITDCPSFLTTIADGQDDVLVLFDPNLEYAEGATKEEPGMMFKNARQELEEKYTDVKAAYLMDEYDSQGKTLFRFPLRNEKMGAKSKISKKITDEKEVKEMLDKLKTHAPGMLIFFRNIKSLSFKYISRSGNVQEEFFLLETYGVTGKKFKEFQGFQKVLAGKLGSVTSMMKFTKTLSYGVCVQHSSAKGNFVYHFDVVEQYGFFNMKQLDQSIIKIMETNELCLIPKGAIASHSKDRECDRCEKISDKRPVLYAINSNNVFCSLPLPICSGLGVLVNGHFILDYETRRSLWSNERMTVERYWNNAILQHCVLPCYLTYLQSRADDLAGLYEGMDKLNDIGRKMDQFYDFFPRSVDPENSTDYWNVFNMSFYKHIFEYNLSLLIVCKVEENDLIFCKPQKEFLFYETSSSSSSTSADKRSKLLKIFQQIHIESDILPERISKNFQICGVPLTNASPEVIRKRLIELEKVILPDSGSVWNVSKTVFKSARNVETVLKYCLSDCKETLSENDMECDSQNELSMGMGVHLDGLPLCLLANEDLISFSEHNPKYFTNHNKIFPTEEHQFVHYYVYQALFSVKVNWQEMKCLVEFTLDRFIELLKGFLPESIYATSDNPIPLAEPVTEYWLLLVWNFLTSLQVNIDPILEKIQSWSLLLTKKAESKYLIPLKKRKGVLYLVGDQCDSMERVVDVLHAKLKVFQPALIKSEEESGGIAIFSKEVAAKIFGTIRQATDLIDALVMNSMKDLSPRGAQIVLQHLETMHQSIDENYASKLREVPLFEKWNGTIAAANGKVLVLSTVIPCVGLELIEAQNCCIFIKEHFLIQKLYASLGFAVCDFSSFYLNFVFPSIHMLTSEVIYKHMDTVKNICTSSCNESNNEELKQQLRILNFIPNEDGVKMSAAQLYDPEKMLFQLAMSEKGFPAKVYCTEDWLPFLRTIGLISSVSRKLFIQFANNIADYETNDQSIVISELLCNELFSNDVLRESEFLHTVKSIKFIIPAGVKRTLETIYRSKNSSQRTICFEDSVYQSDQNLAWTTKVILPKYATDSFSSINKDYPSMLGIKRSNFHDQNALIDHKDVLDHIENITDVTMEQKTKSCKILKEDKTKIYVKILTSFYDYLLERHEKKQRDIDIQRIRSISCILVEEDQRIEKPSRTVLSDEYAIVPYINAISEKHGKYFDIFRSLGCSKHPTAIQYCNVMQEIKSDAEDKALNMNQLQVVKKVVCYLSRVLREKEEADSLKTTLLYFPTVTFQADDVHLTLSTEIIFVDDLKFEKRLKKFTQPLLVPNYDGVTDYEDTEVNAALLKYLPEHIKPKILSKVIEERLVSHDHIKQVKRDHISKKIEARLQSSMFLECFLRLLKHEAKSNLASGENQTLLKQKREDIGEAIQKVKVFVMPIIKTQYFFNDVLIPESEDKKSLFLRQTDDHLEICFDESTTDSTSTFSKISSSLLDFFHAPLSSKTTILLVPMLLSEPLHLLPVKLDDEGILRDEYDSQFIKLGRTKIPGELVPLELHCLLKNDFVDFDKDEYVAVERDQGEGLVYIYAVIRRMDYNEIKILRVYGVQVSVDEADIVGIKATNLYRFDRNATTPIYGDDHSLVLLNKGGFSSTSTPMSEEATKSFEEIIEEIRKIFNDIKSVSKEEQKKVIRRLYLKWHPDKHPKHLKELATEVFKFIQQELERMKGGYEKFFNDWNKRAHRESRSYNNYFKNFNSRNNGGSSRGDGGFNSEHFETPPTFQQKNPQPTEAKKWFKQAQYDISSAENDSNDSHEWICYRAHQASLKALKAFQTLFDYEDDKIDNLTAMASTLSHVELLKLAYDLDNLLGEASSMQYPNSRRLGVPHDLYNRHQSEQAITLTNQILQIVQQQIQNNPEFE